MPRVQLACRADWTKPISRLNWGDWWVKRKLADAFSYYGWSVSESGKTADVIMHLWGKKPREHLRKSAVSVVWLYSYPDQMSLIQLCKYQIVLTTSYLEWQKYQNKHPCCIYMPPCSHLWDEAKPHDLLLPSSKNLTGAPLPSRIPDVVFIGNMRKGGRPIAQFINQQEGLPFTFGIWGTGWRANSKNWIAKYHPYDRLQDLYYSSKAVLVDHLDCMAQAGFLKHQIPDIVASGGIPVVDHIAGINAPWPVYRTPKEALAILIEITQGAKAIRETRQKNIHASMKSVTYRDTVRKIISEVERLR